MIRTFLQRGLSVSWNQSKMGQIQRFYRAAVCKELGKPLTIENLDSPKLEAEQIRVGVRAAAINFMDLLMVQGLYQEKPSLPFTAGVEMAGEIIEVGEGVKHFSKGDHVAGISLIPGAFAEEMVVNQHEVWPVPASISFEAAACIPCSYGTAWLGLTRRAQLKEGETILVTAAAGAVGLATVDLAAHVLGAKVIGAAGGPDKCKVVEKRGGSACIDYTQESIKGRVKELTNGNGANVIFDAVGGDIFKQCVSSIAWEGRILVIGFAGGDIPKIPANLLLVKNITVHGFYWGQHALKDFKAFKKSVSDVMNFAAEGKIKPYFEETFSLDEINNAMKSISARKSIGKVIVKM